MDFRLISEALRNKPETTIIAEGASIRERLPHEIVHYREDEDDAICAKCGVLSAVWLGSDTRWEEHPMRCEAM